MPFDDSGYERRIQALDKMDTVIDLLSDERRWCKDHLRTPDARCCMFGAMEAADATIELERPILLAIEQVTGRNYWWIQNFNDHPLTTHADVVKVLRQARENIATGARPTMEHSIGPWARWRRVLRWQGGLFYLAVLICMVIAILAVLGLLAWNLLSSLTGGAAHRVHANAPSPA